MIRPTSTSCLVVALVALAGVADLAVATRPVDAAALSSTARYTMGPSAAGDGGTDVAEEIVNGMMQCMLGCFTQVFGCVLGCIGKGPDLPLCVVTCNHKSIVCMIRCSVTPSPPGPYPPPAPTPKPPAPKPSPPKPYPPKPPGPPGPPPHKTETTT